MVEVTSEEQNKVKRMKKTEDCLRDFQDNIKHTNIQITRIPKDEFLFLKEYEKIFEETIVENYPNMKKEIIKSKNHKESHTG